MTEQIIPMKSQSSADAVVQVLRYLPLDGTVGIVIRLVVAVEVPE
jgi:hypothetical protein